MFRRRPSDLDFGLWVANGNFSPTDIANLSALLIPSPNYCYSDFEGTLAGDGDAVALMLDQSQGAALGAELVDDILNPANWNDNGGNTVETDGSELRLAYGNSAPPFINLNTTANAITSNLTAGQLYRLDFTARVGSGDTVTFGIGFSTFTAASVVSSTGASEFTVFFVSDGSDRLTVTSSWNTGEEIWISDVSIKEVAGNHAWQATSASRPVLDQVPAGYVNGGEWRLRPDGDDDHMEMPVGTIDYTGSISVWSGYALDNANSDSSPRLLTCDSADGILVYHSSAGEPKNYVLEVGAGASVNLTYNTPLTDNEPVVRGDEWQDATGQKLRLAGRDVTSNTTSYTALEEPSNVYLFGITSSNNLAGDYYGMAIYNGLLTDGEKVKLDRYFADKCGDTGMRKSLLQNMLDFFSADTRYDVTDDFSSYADTAALLNTWTDSSSGTATVALDAGNDEMDLTGDGSNAGTARRTFKTVTGKRYTITVSNSSGSAATVTVEVGTSAGASDLGSDTAAAGADATITFVAESETTHLEIIGGTAAGVSSIESAAIAGTATKGAMWDMTDFDNMGTSTDGSGTVSTSSAVAYVGDKSGNALDNEQGTAADRGTAANDADGNHVDFGSGDYMTADDSADDLAITGDLSIMAVVRPTAATAGIVSSSGDPTSTTTDVAYRFGWDASLNPLLGQGDASNGETETTAGLTLTGGTTTLIEVERDGASVTFWKDEDSTEAETFATVTSPTAGSSPASNTAADVDGTGAGQFDLFAELRADRKMTLNERVRNRGYLQSLTEADVT